MTVASVPMIATTSCLDGFSPAPDMTVKADRIEGRIMANARLMQQTLARSTSSFARDITKADDHALRIASRAGVKLEKITGCPTTSPAALKAERITFSHRAENRPSASKCRTH